MKESFVRRAYRIIWKIVNKLTVDNITLYSAQSAYFTVVSMIPFAIVLVPLLTAFIPDDTIRVLNDVILMLPGDLGAYADEVLSTLFRMPDASVISVYVLISLWAASKSIMSLQNGLHGIYRIKETENYFIRRLRCMMYTTVFLLAIALALILLVMGNQFQRLLLDQFSILARVAKLILAFRTIIIFVIFILAFTFAYQYLTGSNCTFWDAFPGVLLTTIGWMVFSWIYSLYITYLTRYITLYGSLGALILLFLWLYICFLIFMIGAEFNYYFAARRDRLIQRASQRLRSEYLHEVRSDGAEYPKDE